MNISVLAKEVLLARGMHIERMLRSGHTGASLFLANKGGKRFVLKCGIESEAVREIEDNLFGYRALADMNAGEWIPSSEGGKHDGVPFLLMAWAGEEDWSTRDRARPYPTVEVDRFADEWLRMVDATSASECVPAGIPALDSIRRFWTSCLISRGFISGAALPLLDRAAEAARTTRIAATPLDFTPDNVFFDGTRFLFIDPWRQSTYGGNSAICWGQFVTLAHEVYRLPSTLRLVGQFDRVVDRLSTILQTDSPSVEAGYLIGSALQFTLSSFVRVESDRNRAQEFADKAVAAVTRIH